MNETNIMTDAEAIVCSGTAARMKVLERFGILDTERDVIFDGIADLAAALFDAPVAVVNFIADGRQFFKAEVGIGARELPIATSICAHALPEGDVFVVPDLALDNRFAGNPLVTVQDGMRFYAGYILEADGIPIGAVCVLDRQPRPEGITEPQRIGLKALGTQTMFALAKSAEARRDRFRLSLAEQMQDAAGPVEMMEAATQLLGEYLAVSQVGFAEVDSDQAHLRVERDWNDGRMESVVGRWRMDDFGPESIVAMKAGRTLVIDDVHDDTRSNGSLAAKSYEAIGARSVIVAPLVRGHSLVATLFVHHTDPRVWHRDDIALVEDIATRLWGAVLRARADADIETRSRELAALIGTAPIGFAYFDRDHRYLRINDELAAINGLPAADHIGVCFDDLMPINAATVSPIIDQVFATGEVAKTIEVTGDTPLLPGVMRHWLTSWFPVFGDHGEVVSVGAWVVEITERRRAEDAQAASEAQLRQAQSLGGIGSWEWNHATGQGTVSDSYRSMHGLPLGQSVLSSDDLLSVTHADDRLAVRDAVARGLATGDQITTSYRVTLPSGEVRDIRGVGQRVGAAESTITAGIVEDVTKRRMVERLLANSEVKYRAVFEQAGVGVARVSLQGPFLEVNNRYCTILGRSCEELIGKDWVTVTAPDDLAADAENFERLLAGEASNYSNERRYVAKDGSDIWVNLTISLVRDAQGVPAFFVAVAEDITARKQAELALADSEAIMRTVMDAAPVGLVFADTTGQVTHGNARLVEIIGHPLIHSPDIDAYAEYVSFHADGRQVEAREYPFARVLTGEAERAELEVLYRRGDGRDAWVHTIAAALRSENGTLLGAVGAMLDIDAERRAQQELLRLNAVLADEVATAVAERTAALQDRDRTWNNARDLLVVLGADGVFRDVNPAWTTILGYDHDELVGRFVFDLIIPDDVATAQELGEVTSGPILNFKNRYRHKDGSERMIEWVGVTEGNAIFAHGRDVTEEEKRRAQLAITTAQLHEAQKLETIGQLTGGVAHDFNNLLTPIMAVLEMMERRVAGEERTSRLVSGALQSAERAKNLIQRLLAFARRQHLETRAVDIGLLLADMRDLIDRSIGPTIAIEVNIASSLPAVTVDPNQLELALLNLSINARDAMPGGGTLRFEARAKDVRPGQIPDLGAGSYICFTVTDTGSGMDADTAKRCIEPFYTSKGVGEGTGLGLSMVHGMMRQLGGSLEIISTPGQGTSMQLWLPCSDDIAEESITAPASLIRALQRFTILLVDDEDFVRESTADLLDRRATMLCRPKTVLRHSNC